MVKKRAVACGRSKKISKGRVNGRGPSGKTKHSKVAKLIKLAKKRAKSGKAGISASKKKKR